MDLKKLSELEIKFHEDDFNEDDKILKEKIIKDIANFELYVWKERADVLIRTHGPYKDMIKISCPKIKSFDFPKGSDKHGILNDDIHFNYNNKFYIIRQLLLTPPDYSGFF